MEMIHYKKGFGIHSSFYAIEGATEFQIQNDSIY